MNKKIEINLPIKTISEANRKEHWTISRKRHKLQQKEIYLFCKNLANVVNLPATIVLTRLAPKHLDVHDNLPISLKWVSDAIADCIIPGLAKGQADSKLSWKYNQVKSKQYGIKIEIFYEKKESEPKT